MTTQTSTYAPIGSTIQDKRSTLRRALKSNATFSALSGAICLLASAQVAEFLGIHNESIFGLMDGATFILELGIALIVFAGWVLFNGTRERIIKPAVIGIIIGDILWVAASGWLLLSNALPLSTAGGWTVLLLADVVLVFAFWQSVGLRRLGR